MEFNFQKVQNDNIVYMREGNFVLIAKMNDKVYCPNFSFVCVSNAEMATIKELVTQVKSTGTQRVTRSGRTAIDGGTDVYAISIITLENGKLVDISFKESTHPLYGLSLKYIEQSNGTTQLTTDANFVYFPPSGTASFDLGFSRKKVKVGNNFYDKNKKAFVTTYGDEETFLTVPSMGNSDGFLRAYRGMKLLESAIEFAGQHMTPVSNNSGIDSDLMKAVGGNIPF